MVVGKISITRRQFSFYNFSSAEVPSKWVDMVDIRERQCENWLKQSTVSSDTSKDSIDPPESVIFEPFGHAQ